MSDQSIIHIALIYLAVINVVTFFVYGIDKAASKRGQSQTRLSYAESRQNSTEGQVEGEEVQVACP